MNYGYLMAYINGAYQNTKEQIEELEKVLADSIAYAKETRQPVLINNWCGNFDLLVTDCRIHVILIHKTFELPEIEEDDNEEV
jgi:hypothetical protein